jgi:hypothetical protein
MSLKLKYLCVCSWSIAQPGHELLPGCACENSRHIKRGRHLMTLAPQPSSVHCTATLLTSPVLWWGTTLRHSILFRRAPQYSGSYCRSAQPPKTQLFVLWYRLLVALSGSTLLTVTAQGCWSKPWSFELETFQKTCFSDLFIVH